MPFGYDWECRKCHYSIRTGGLWEFYIDEHGLRQPYGHPVPVSEEAIKAGVKGFFGLWYCPKCRQIINKVVIEFDVPIDGSFNANLAGLEKTGKKEYPAICDKCGSDLIEYLDKHNLCPACNKGHFKQTSRFMS
jgi:hypothetical protein